MKKWFFTIFCFLKFSIIFAETFPIDSKILKAHLSSGVKVWMAQNDCPSEMISIRIIGKNGIDKTVYQLDVFNDEEEEIREFIKEKSQKLYSFQGEVAVVVVGNFDEKQLLSAIENEFAFFSSFSCAEKTKPISLSILEGHSSGLLKLFYDLTIKAVNTTEQLKTYWTSYFLNEFIQEKFKRNLKQTGGFWIREERVPFVLASSQIQVQSRFSEENLLEILNGMLTVITDFRKESLSTLELNELKTKIQRHLFSLNRKEPDNETIANFFVDQILENIEMPEFGLFMKSSLLAISEISIEDIESFAEQNLTDKLCQIEIQAPLTTLVVMKDVEEVFDLFKIDFKNSEIVHTENRYDTDLNLYYQLSATSEEIAIIGEIIKDVAELSPFALLAKKSEMDKKGDRIHHVHPFRFLGTIFSDPYLKSCMSEIKKSFFKWKGFLGGVKERLQEEDAKDNLSLYIPGFCQVVQAHPDQVKMLIQRKDWEGLVKYLIRLNLKKPTSSLT